MSEIIYNSDLIIRNASELATLCVFYDKVYLPHTSSSTSDKFAGARFYDVTMPRGIDAKFEKEFVDDVDYWGSVYKALIDEKVVERLPSPPWGVTPPKELLENLKLSEKIELLTKSETLRSLSISNKPLGPLGETEESLGNPDHWVIKEYLIKQDLALHFLRNDLKLSQLFIYSGDRPSRDFLVGVEAKATFSYLLPELGYLKADQILEVRNKVKDNREGFSMHLQTLSKGIDDRLKGGEQYPEIERWAKNIIETQLIPDYRQFRRQLEAQRSGYWSNVLGKAFGIDAALWSPKFWSELLKAFGFTMLAAISERKEMLSNENQAYLFMKKVEDIKK